MTEPLSLRPHLTTPSRAVDRINVEVKRVGATTLELRYQALGNPTLLKPADLEHSGRADGLWRHTCFEAFVKPEGRDGYLECNFAGFQWATYSFTGYREGMVADPATPTVIKGGLDWLFVEIDIGHIARADMPAPALRLGLSAVIEAVDGSFSYWALAHPSDKPDFHHPDSFVLELP